MSEDSAAQTAKRRAQYNNVNMINSALAIAQATVSINSNLPGPYSISAAGPCGAQPGPPPGETGSSPDGYRGQASG